MALPSDYAALAAPPATPRAQALLFSRPERRAALTALYALDAEIAAASAPTLEHSVAHTKLGWWRAEVDRLRGGRPEHPITRALLAAAGSVPDYALLHERLAGADLQLASFAPATDAELDAYAYRTHGAVQQLAAQVLGESRAEALAALGAHLGRGIALTEIVRDVRQDAVHGTLRLPVERLDAAGIAPEQLQRTPLPPTLATVLEPLVGRAHAALDAALAAAATLPRPERRAQSHAYVLAALHGATLERIADARYDVTRRHTLHPLAQLWTAWRAARRA
jgi:phytoene synthase